MGMDNIQLKQEDVLDGQPVLSDINPVTNTNSVDNPATGEKLDETISRMWSTINNKLTRIVNSVNGRTGVIVLTAEDVGLGDVDNVSYAEIKQWVRETMEGEFANRALKLYHSLAEALAVCATNDRSYIGAPFYCDITNDSDKRAAIGFYYWDNNELKADHRSINTIGGTNSVAEDVGNTGASINYVDGVITVKIHPDEHALYVETNDGEGLRIDESKLRGNTYFFNCLYGSGTQTQVVPDPTSFLALYNDWKTENADTIEFYIDDIRSNTTLGSSSFLNSAWDQDHKLVQGDLIITNFAYKEISGTGITPDTGLMGQQPAIGLVTSVTGDDTIQKHYTIKFYTIKTFIGGQYGFGLTYFPTHTNDPGYGTSTGMLGIRPLTGIRTFGPDGERVEENYSGLNVICGSIEPNTAGPDTSPGQPVQTFFTPWGPEYSSNTKCGISIGTDPTFASYSRVPLQPASDTYIDDMWNPNSSHTPKYFGSSRVRNWVLPLFINQLEYNSRYWDDPEGKFIRENPEHGYASNRSGLTVNLNKMVEIAGEYFGIPLNDWMYTFSDMSGLKYTCPPDTVGGHPNLITIDASEFGMPDGKDTDGNDISGERVCNWFSGGLMINIGKYLEIRPKKSEKAEEYDQGGKLQVRIGKGLTEEIEWVETLTKPANFDNPKVYDNYYSKESDGTYTPLPYWTILTTEEPDNWDKLYTSYYVKDYTKLSGSSAPTWEADKYYAKGEGPYEYILTTEEPVDWSTDYRDYYTEDGTYSLVARVYRGDIPTWQENTFYAHFPYSWGQPPVDPSWGIYERRTHNRVTLDLDPDTLGFSEDGKLTVVGGVGGQNIRVVDDRGCYFDTVPNRTKVDDVLKLGAGLKVVGGYIPDDLAYGVSTLKSCVLEALGAASAVEILDYMITHPDPPDYTVLTTATLQSIASGRTSLSTALSVPGVTKETIQSIGDALYDSAENVKDVLTESTVRLYMTDGETSISSRVTQLYESIDEDTTNRTAYFTAIKDHYGLTGDATKENLTSQIFTMPFYDSSQTNPYLFDWLFSLGFAENG